jgi:hypothetical protein
MRFRDHRKRLHSDRSFVRATVPQNVPRQFANQAAHARYAQHAHTFFSDDFVSIENKERLIYFPKLDVAGSIPPSPAPNFLSEVYKSARLQRTAVSQRPQPRILLPDLVIPCGPFTVREGMDIQNQTRFTYKTLRAVRGYEQVRISGAKRSTPQPW